MQTTTAPPRVSRGQWIFDALRHAGLNARQAAGVLGNSAVETGGTFSPTAYNPAEHAIGIAQWEGGRRAALQAFAAARGTSETNLATQVAFLIREAKARGNWAEVRGARSATEAAHLWQRDFEVSAPGSLGQRESNARAIFATVHAGRPIPGAGALNPSTTRRLAPGGAQTLAPTAAPKSSGSASSGGPGWSDLLPWNWGNGLSKLAAGVVEVLTSFALKALFVVAGLGLVVLGLYLAGRGRSGGVPIPL